MSQKQNKLPWDNLLGISACHKNTNKPICSHHILKDELVNYQNLNPTSTKKTNNYDDCTRQLSILFWGEKNYLINYLLNNKIIIIIIMNP